MNVEAIKPHLAVYARSIEAMHIAPHVQIGRVDHVEGNSLKLSRGDSEDAHEHWVPLEWIETVSEQGVYLSKNVEEYLWGRLDDAPKQ